MVEETAGPVTPPLREPVGERLRAAREAAGLTLADIGQRTRIPLRHLEAIETSSYGTLPSITYAMGFARAYARVVGMDDAVIAQDLRGELATTWEPRPRHEPYDPVEPARLPPRAVALAGVVVAILILLGVGLWFGTSMFRGEDPVQVAAVAPTTVATPDPAGAMPVPTPTPAGRVTLTATDEVWVRIYNGAGDTLMMKTMQPGEAFEVPPGADRPMINIGRPDKMTVTIDGETLPPLGTGERPIKDVDISADALRARAGGVGSGA